MVFIRILHTSDLHLSKKRKETVEGLHEVLRVAKEHEVDVLTIGGDLFESDKDAEVLRPHLRKVFSDNKFDIVAIPGNHDREAYRKNLSFGSDLKILTQEPFEVYSLGESIAITGVPFVDRPSEELITMLTKQVNPDMTNILLLHCTLDIQYASSDFGDEERRGDYFPISGSTLSTLGHDYVFAGHFHGDFEKRLLDNGCQFVYPGSPVSTSWKHTGQRKVALLDTEEGDIKEIPIDSFYYDVLSVLITPGMEKERLSEIKKWIGSHAGKKCELRVEVNGYGKMDENKFEKLLKKACAQAEFDNLFRNVEDILEHPLYVGFKKIIKTREEIPDKGEVDYRAIEVLAGLKANRRIR